MSGLRPMVYQDVRDALTVAKKTWPLSLKQGTVSNFCKVFKISYDIEFATEVILEMDAECGDKYYRFKDDVPDCSVDPIDPDV